MARGSTEWPIIPSTPSALSKVHFFDQFEPNTGLGERSMAVAMIDPVAVGDVLPDEWPAHITLLHWARLDDDQWPVFDATMADIIDDWGFAGGVVLGERRFYGPNEDLEVRSLRLDGAMRLYPLHLALFALMKRLGTQFDETYAGVDHWSPHVTVPQGRTFTDDQVVPLNNITIAQKSPELGGTVVTRVYRLDQGRS